MQSAGFHASVFDNDLFRSVFTTDAMRKIFSDDNQIKAYVDAEIALAIAEGECGLIPQDAAKNIAKIAPSVTFDRDKLRSDTENVGYPIIGIVKQLVAKTGEAGRYIHWGATTQDIMDTATILQVREALEIVEADLAIVITELTRLARLYRNTVMAGRTHLQQALPVTFGHKLAIYLAAMQRHQERLQELKPRLLVAQLGGAAGTLASLQDKGILVRQAFARALKLHDPAITWHVSRDALTEAVQLMALICGSLGKIGFDVMILMATEISEVFEPFASHRGGSSTMPQKRNPISSEILVANAKLAREQASLMLDAMVSDLERATGPWHVEWVAVPQSFMVTAGSLHQAKFMLSGLTIDEGNMQRNLASTHGLIVAEAVMMGLAPALGRQNAHDVVYAACRVALGQKRPLYDVLCEEKQITANVSLDVLKGLCNPANYLGTAGEMVDMVAGK